MQNLLRDSHLLERINTLSNYVSVDTSKDHQENEIRITMKQREINRWVNHQIRINRQATMPVINWALLVGILVVITVLLIVILRAAHML